MRGCGPPIFSIEIPHKQDYLFDRITSGKDKLHNI